MKLGRHILRINKIKSSGAYLMSETDEEIFMPTKYVDDLKVDSEIEVFVYDNGRGDRVATTTRPYIQVGEVKKLQVVSKTKFGYFVDIGLDKDIFLPFKETIGRINPQEYYLMMLYIDKSDRLCVTMNIEKKLKRNEDNRYKVNDIVSGSIYLIDNRGAHVAIDDQYDGLVLKEELKGIYKVGDVVETRIQRILQDDRITLTLREKAYKQMHQDAEILLELIEDNNGVLPLGDKSDSELIKEVTGLSKSAFKKAEGALYKKKMVELYPEKIVLKKRR